MCELDKLPIPLLLWYRENARILPWRQISNNCQFGVASRPRPDPYPVLVSEIMLQQTRVAAVLGYFARFMDELPTVAALAAVDEDRLMKLWQGLGYYNRARNLQKAAAQIVTAFGGAFPTTYEALLTLPGVGAYTAGAVASIALGIPVPAVDGNVLRVTARITGDSGDVSKPETKSRMGAALLACMPRDAAGDFNQALMELGATVCLPNGPPLCVRCPAAAFCRAYLDGRIGDLPVKGMKKPRRVEERIVFLLFNAGRVALRRRPERGLLAKLWEYPNALSPAEGALAEWGFPAARWEKAGTSKHIFTHIEWRMEARVAFLTDEILPEGWVWASWEALVRDYAVPNAFQSFAHIVREQLQGD